MQPRSVSTPTQGGNTKRPDGDLLVRIKRFSSLELADILQNHINKVFYPWAAIPTDLLELLSHYWFIHIVEPKDPHRIGYITIPLATPSARLAWTERAEREFTPFPESIESALRELCLFDWAGCGRVSAAQSIMSRKQDRTEAWLKFDVPFVIAVNDDLIDFPEHLPHIPELATEPFVDGQTGEELGTVPQVNVSLNQRQTDEFVAFTKNIGHLIRSLNFGNWDFLDIALGYFTKTFLTPPGLEQLLWHVTALEALMGEKDHITAKIGSRLGLILGDDDTQRMKLKKRWEELYHIRSRLVHGARLRPADLTAIIDAYRFCRLAVIWFLHYLGSIQSRIVRDEVHKGVPSRQEILSFIDIDVDGLRWLMEKIPKQFPRVPQWLE